MICWLYPRFPILPSREWQQCWSNNIRLYKSALLPHPRFLPGTECNQAGAAVAAFINEHKNSAGYWSGYRGGTWCTHLLVPILDKLLGLFSKYFTIDKQVNEWMKKRSQKGTHESVPDRDTSPSSSGQSGAKWGDGWSPLNIHYSIAAH